MDHLNDMSLTLDSDAMYNFKADFQTVLAETLTNMLQNGESEGTVSAKIKISLLDELDSWGEPYKMPLIAHEITGAVQQKHTAKGTMPGMFSLEFDKDENCYVLRPVLREQTTMDDYLP